jgi:hypothetical protein
VGTPTIPPMTRGPFMNMVPDWLVTGPEFLWKGVFLNFLMFDFIFTFYFLRWVDIWGLDIGETTGNGEEIQVIVNR